MVFDTQIAYRYVFQNGNEELRSDSDEIELAEEQNTEALAKQDLDSIDREILLLNRDPLEMKNVSTQARTGGLKNRKALKQAMTAEYQDRERVPERATC